MLFLVFENVLGYVVDFYSYVSPLFLCFLHYYTNWSLQHVVGSFWNPRICSRITRRPVEARRGVLDAEYLCVYLLDVADLL